MQVEAMIWSDIGPREYAAALQLSPHSLRKCRDRLRDGDMEIDWRAHLHPSARTVVGTRTSDGASKVSLTVPAKNDPEAARQPVRCFFSDEEKRAIVAETEAPGVSVSAVARKHGVVTGLLFRWRVQFGVAQQKRAKLAPVTMPVSAAETRLLSNLVQPPGGIMAMIW
jgi:transposase-like protein